ncbi:MAG: penicillin-binding protein 2 [Flavobacteriales bacterium]|nr:penicillin-binding protein 2 [Flavobacteriales bacterium]
MRNYENRQFVLLLIYITVAVIFIIRLLFMQVLTDKWSDRAAEISEYKLYTYAPRGIIYDRAGEKLVENKTFYDLMVTPRKMKEMDTLAFCKLVGISKEDFDKKIEAAKNYSFNIPSEFEKQISSDQFEVISEELYKYPGFFAQDRTMRGYRREIGAHVFGYISEVSPEDIEKNPYYRPRDYIGKKGLEQSYEEILRGERGVRYLLKDAIGKESGSYENGKYDTMSVPGKNIYCTIDAKLQEYGELLMQNKKGSIVAIEPKTGEIIAMVSSPTYAPSLMTGREKGKNYYGLLNNDSLKPLYNRAIQAMYPPGSIFKMAQALIGLQEGVIDFNTGFPCDKSLVGCHNHPGASSLSKAVQYSCNPYFFRATQRIIQQGKSRSIFKDAEMGLRRWTEYMYDLGFGVQLEVDIPSLKKGFIPNVEFYDKYYGKGRWAFSTIYSISIGQGEVLVVPMQMANFTAIIANRGFYITPHFIRGIGKPGEIPEKYKTPHKTKINTEYFEPLVEAMRAVVEEPGGTASSAKLPNITVCGKTGTAQNPHGEDHSVFIAFAPKDDPKIAISVYVENAGFGGQWAAPIASLMIEKYLTGTVTDTIKEKRMIDAVILDVKKEKATTNAKSKKRKGL